MFSYRWKKRKNLAAKWMQQRLMHHCARIRRVMYQSVQISCWNGSTKTSWHRVTDGSWTRRTRKDTENIIVLGGAPRKYIFWSIIMACNGARSTAVRSVPSVTLPATDCQYIWLCGRDGWNRLTRVWPRSSALIDYIPRTWISHNEFYSRVSNCSYVRPTLIRMMSILTLQAASYFIDDSIANMKHVTFLKAYV